MSSTCLVTSFSSTSYKANKRIRWCFAQLRMNQFALTWFYLKTNEQKKEPIKLTLFTEKIKFIFWMCIKWKLKKTLQTSQIKYQYLEKARNLYQIIKAFCQTKCNCCKDVASGFSPLLSGFFAAGDISSC